MHAYVLVRGTKRYVRRWQEDLEIAFLPHKFAEDKVGAVQLSVRPIQLFEVVFPEAEKEKVLKLIGALDYPNHTLIRKAARFFARILGLEPCQPVKDPIIYPHIEVFAIGTLQDVKKDGIEKL